MRDMKPERELRVAHSKIVQLTKRHEVQTRDVEQLRREVDCLRTARDAALKASVVAWRPPSKP